MSETMDNPMLFEQITSDLEDFINEQVEIAWQSGYSVGKKDGYEEAMEEKG